MRHVRSSARRGRAQAARRARGSVSVAAMLVVCVLVALLLGVTARVAGDAGAASSERATGTSGRVPSAGLSQAWATASGVWAVVAMGDPASAASTYWELLFLPAGSSRWRLVTPPGVASSGGLSTSGPTGARSAPSLVVGVQPSHELAYSPVARSSDEGTTWTAGVLPSALVDQADAVTAGPAGSALAVVRAHGGELLRSDGSLTRWSSVVTAGELGATLPGRACRLQALTAVAAPSDGVLLGGDCARPGTLGIFSAAGGSWSAAPAPASLRHSQLGVLRLTATPGSANAASALVEARRGAATSLVVLWRRASGAWVASSSARVHGTVLASGLGPGEGVVAVTGLHGRADQVLWLGGPGARWRALGAPPTGTRTAVARAAGGAGGADVKAPQLIALAVSGSDVTMWQRGAASGRWGRIERFRVPIANGSST